MMKNAWMAVGAVVLSILVGCGPVEAEENLPIEELAPENLAAIPDGTVMSPELMSAVLAKVPKPQGDMLQPAAACMAAKTCTNLGYNSCGSWSATYNCGSLSTCNTFDTACRDCQYSPDIGAVECTYLGGQNQGKNRYRVCFNSAGASCTEYEYTSTKVCGGCPD
ncbi:hypothetical protein [Hyalangium minutum]|uniref:Lipoprotein n=1 Tax=Hyalangium minutum TaxID=394096 RepID=A0A085WR43_9BACT|nr:hypothetical protein [Hyalangium minutum]KFE70156.1 hypothetical protein DB31_5198 [Hyalangium minutum]